MDLGADLVMHSATKYLGGHSDVVMGALVMNDQSIADEIYRIQNSSGGITGPMDSFLVLRGLKTLHLRMQRHCENGEKIARSEEHTSELQSRPHLVCRLLLEKKKKKKNTLTEPG